MATIRVLAAATAANLPPTLATQGVPLRGAKSYIDENFGEEDTALAIVKSTAGSLVMTGTVRMWGYVPAATTWVPLGAGSVAAPDASRGVLNAGQPIGELGTDPLQHSEIIRGLRNVTRVYAEVTAIGGTATAIDVWLQSSRVSGQADAR